MTRTTTWKGTDHGVLCDKDHDKEGTDHGGLYDKYHNKEKDRLCRTV